MGVCILDFRSLKRHLLGIMAILFLLISVPGKTGAFQFYKGH